VIARLGLILMIALALGVARAAALPHGTPKVQTRSLPTTWRADGIGVTIVGLRDLGTNLAEIELSGVDARKGYTFVGVQGRWRNFLHRAVAYGQIRDHGPRLPQLKLVTTRGNIYERSGAMVYGLAIPPASGLWPEEIADDWEVFEIRLNEKPRTLLGYVYTGKPSTHDPKAWRLAYRWPIKAR